MILSFNVKPMHFYLFASGMFLVFAGVRIHFIMVYASQTPYWDDWGMGNRMALYMQSGFDPSWLYGLTNEHRATFSKLTNLLLFKLNNHQWDPYITMVLDAFIWGAIGVFMLYIGVRERNNINLWFYSILVVVLWTYPLSLFNTLSTIQTYLYYMIAFSVCGFWLLTNNAFSLKWYAGILLVGAACMTAGGGSFAPIAVTAVSFFLAIFNKQNRSQHIATATLACMFTIFGLYVILSQGSSNPVGSKSLAPFISTLLKTLSWPASDRAWPSLIFLLPIGILALGIAFRKIPQSRLATFTLMMAAFGIMLSIAIAYARGGAGRGPAERYFDFLTIYLISSALSLMLIQPSIANFSKALSRGLIILWISMCVIAVPYHLKVSKFQLNDRAGLVPVQDQIMARYSVANDPEILKNRPFRHVPFPRVNTLQEFVERLQQTDAMPYSLQPSSMRLPSDSNTFIVNGIARPKSNLYRGLEPVLGSYNAAPDGGKAVGEYTSEIFVARRPYVMIPVSGYLSYDKLSLSLVGENNGKIIDVIQKVRADGLEDQWYEILVKAPDTKYRIVAKDKSSVLWFAFAAPRSVGNLSFLVDRTIAIGDKIWALGLLLILIALAYQTARFLLQRIMRARKLESY